MGRPKKARKITPQEPSMIERFEEANSARLGLICAQERIPADYTRWDIEIPIDDRVATLTCISPAEYGGVPHGLDGDFATALNLLYLEQGAPDSGEVQVTAYQLLQKAGFADSGQYYNALQESLDRLKGATYTASESWRDKRQKRWTTVKFNFIEQIEADTISSPAFGEGTLLRIRLARPVVQSLRDQYLKPLDMTFMQSLNRSLTRSLYRMLDARRYDPVHMNDPVSTLRMPLTQWGKELKLLETTPARIRRNLEGAHSELLERGYLRTVEYSGSRGATVIQYEFGDLPTSLPAPEPAIQVLPDSPMVEALVRHGVKIQVARKLSQTYDDAHLSRRLERFTAILEGGFKPSSPAAFLVDVIKDTGEKYGPDVAPVRPAEIVLSGNRTLQRAEAMDDEEPDRLEKEFLALSHEEQAARAAAQVRMFVGRELSDRHLRSLHQSMLEGKTVPAVVRREVIRAASELRLPEFAASIREGYSAEI